MRALVVGIGGFVGSHLAEYTLRNTDIAVAGILRPGGDRHHVAHLLSQITTFFGDVADYSFLERVLDEWRPDYVFHLAAQSAPALSFAKAQETLTVNVLGQYNVLEAMAHTVPRAACLVVGSAEEYGVVRRDELPISEANPLRPTSPYAVSKIAQDMLGYQFFLSRGLRTVRVRPFNHIGPRQSETFATASFAKQIAEIEAGRREPTLRVGNLETKRDFCDVRDIVRAYWLALLHATSGDVYNLGSGRSRSLAEMLQMLVERSPLDITVAEDPDRIRHVDVLEMVCDASKFRGQTGWQAEISIEQSVSDLLEYWRARVGEG